MTRLGPTGAPDLFSHFSDESRLLRLTTPIRSTLRAECVRGEEAIDAGYSFVVGALSTDADVTLKTLMGQPVLLELLTASSRDVLRPFHGHVTSAEFKGANGGLARYQLTVEPWFAFLGYGRDSRVFQDMTVFDILDAVFTSWQGKGRLVSAWRFDLIDRAVYPVRSLTTQYQESDRAFVQRLMSQEGLFYYFEHAGDFNSPSLGNHTMVISDHNGSFKTNLQPSIEFTQASGVIKRDSIDRWRTEVRSQSSAINLSSWDYRTRSSRPVSAGADGDTANGSDVAVSEPVGPYSYESSAQGQRRVDNTAKALSSRKERHIGAGTVRTLAPGTTFLLDGHPRYSASADEGAGKFAVIRTVHLMHNNLSAELKAKISHSLPICELSKRMQSEEAGSLHSIGRGPGERPLYRVRIDAIRADLPYKSGTFDDHGAPVFPRPTIIGQQTAIVVGPAGSVIHTDRDQRVKVQFHWQRGSNSHSRLDHPNPAGHTGAPGDDTAGTWVRVATPMGAIAGANWGSHAVPRVGQEVLVDFLEGDIDRPVVIASLYNGEGSHDAQGNNVGMNAGAATGNAPAWFPGESGAHAHPAALSGYKSQAMSASQTGTGAFNQLVLDDTAGKARISLQRHTAAHGGTDELNLGQLRHQTDNALLAPSGFGAELKTNHSVALRAGRGMLLSSEVSRGGIGAQLDVSQAVAQIESCSELQKELAAQASKHNAELKAAQEGNGAEGQQSPAIEHLANTVNVLRNQVDQSVQASEGGSGTAPAFSEPHLQLSGTAGIVASTPASAVLVAGSSTSIVGQEINLVSQANSVFSTADGIALFTYGKAQDSQKLVADVGIKLHAATGKVISASQAGETRLTADQTVTFASTNKSVTVVAPVHVLLTAQGASLRLEGGNIHLHGPGRMEFKAGKKELAGPAIADAVKVDLPRGKLAECPAKLGAAGAGGASSL